MLSSDDSVRSPTSGARRGRGRRRLRHRGHRGQTTIEFSFAFILLLLGVFGAVSSAVWAIENMAAISATENALRILSSATSANAGADSAFGSPTNNAAAVLAINNKVVPQLKPAMFGTQIKVGYGPGPSLLTSCPPGATPAAQIASVVGFYSRPTVVICAGVVAVAGGQQVQVHVIGCSASMVPPAFGITGCKYGVPVDDFGAVQALIFNT